MKKVKIRYSIIAALLLLVFSPALLQSQEITDNVKAVIQYLASDELEGRLAGTQGNEKAAAFIIEQFKSIGLQPIGGSYSQTFDIAYRKKLSGKSRVTITKIIKRPGLPPDMWLKAKKNWTPGKEFMPVGVSSNDSASGELAFVGYGISAPDLNYDDYANIDVKGKIVIIISDSADGQPLDERFINYATLRYKAENAKNHGAVGIVFVKRLSDSANTFYKFKIGDIMPGCGLPAIQVKRTEIAKYFPKKNKLYPVETRLMETKQPQSFILPDVSMEINVELDVEKVKVSNVFAMLKGTEKPDEYIVIGAHFDHLGHGEIQIKRRSRYPQIYNGADDNASGVAAMLELARRFKANPPRHSIIFAGFNAEEMGLLGSSYFANNPPVAIEKIKAMFNFDMVGRLQEKIIVFGTGSSHTLNSIVKNIATADSIDYATNSEDWGPSDHASFIDKNIPALFFFTGTHEDYNTPRDDWNRINYKGLLKVTDFAERIIRNADSRNEIDFATQHHHGGGHYKSKIKVSFGSIPDFANTANGFAIKGCRPDSPCEKAGMQAGDILLSFNGKKVKDIKDFTIYLMEVNPGDTVEIIYLHNGEKITKKVQLNAK
jgi:hypothetical protein